MLSINFSTKSTPHQPNPLLQTQSKTLPKPKAKLTTTEKQPTEAALEKSICL